MPPGGSEDEAASPATTHTREGEAEAAASFGIQDVCVCVCVTPRRRTHEGGREEGRQGDFNVLLIQPCRCCQWWSGTPGFPFPWL